MDETTQSFINLMQTAFADVVKDNLRRERLKAAATITAAILQNPHSDPRSLDAVRAAATYGVCAVEIIEKDFATGAGGSA